MPGMSSGVAPGNSTIVSAFQSALLRQALVVVVILVLLALAWSVLRSVQLRNALAQAAGAAAAETTGAAIPGANGRAGLPAFTVTLAPGHEPWGEPEPSGRRFLRIGFGLLWVFDGILQGQTSMPLGMTTKVIDPTAAASPAWVQHIVHFGSTIWSDHPIVASTATVWIQLGIGLWLLVAPRGRWSRAAGVASLAWGLVVWVFGEAFGGLFASGASWLFGAPGAVLLYCLVGALLVLDERRWSSGQVGRFLLRAMGLLFLAMAVLQAWPGRGFWQGRVTSQSRPGTLAAMVRTMAGTPQPHYVSSWMSAFASFVEAHGFAVNLFVVVVLAALGLAFMAKRTAIVGSAVLVSVVVGLADWVLVEDFGFFGGTGTDPNSMIPMLIVIVGGYLAVTRATVEAEVLSPELELPINLEPDLGWVSEPPPPELPATWRERVRARPVYTFRALAAAGAVAVVLLGAAPMAAASLNKRADPIVDLALNGFPSRVHLKAPGFLLREQNGSLFSLSSLRGKVVVLTFLDPVSTLGSPVIAQELRQSSTLLGSQSGRVEFVAVVANSQYRSAAALQAFDRAEGLADMSNWLYLTGPVRHLMAAWKAYGVDSRLSAWGPMIPGAYRVFVIDATGWEQYQLNADPWPSDEASQASFAAVLAATVQQVLTTQ